MKESYSNPAYDSFGITPDNSTVVEFKALYVGGAGDVTIVTAAGNTALFEAVPAGTILPAQGTKVKSTGTTATKITGMR